MNVKYSVEAELLEALRRQENAAFKQLYQSTFRSVEYFVTNNSGKQQDARDIFQDAIIDFMSMIKKPNFELKAKVGTVLFSICRNKWRKYLRDKHGKEINIIDDEEHNFVPIQEDNIDEKIVLEAKHEIVKDLFDTMGDLCKEIINHFYFKRLSHNEIAKLMGYTSAYARVRLTRCLNKLRKEAKEALATANS